MQTLVCCRYKGEKKMDEVTHTILPNTAGGGWGGTAPDAEFMKMSHIVDETPPETWKKYDVNTDQGIKKIIEMEYQELMNAKNKADKITNIYHLSVALLRYWRMNKDE